MCPAHIWFILFFSSANMAAMYYGYCMLPDGTYCLAPPPPGIDASVYYTSMPTSMMPTPSAPGPPPPPGTVPLLDPAAAIPSAPATVPVTVTAPASLSHSAPADPPTSRSACHCCIFLFCYCLSPVETILYVFSFFNSSALGLNNPPSPRRRPSPPLSLPSSPHLPTSSLSLTN